MVCSYRHLRCDMPDQLFLPGFERHPAFDALFFALLLQAENASQIVQLRQRLCEEFGLSGRRIAADLLHISLHGTGSLHGIGAYDGFAASRGSNAQRKLVPRFWRNRSICAGSCDELWSQARSSAIRTAHRRRSGAGYFPSVAWWSDEKCRISPNSIASRRM